MSVRTSKNYIVTCHNPDQMHLYRDMVRAIVAIKNANRSRVACYRYRMVIRGRLGRGRTDAAAQELKRTSNCGTHWGWVPLKYASRFDFYVTTEGL